MLFAICKNKVIAVQRTAETQERVVLTFSLMRHIINENQFQKQTNK